MKSAEAHSMSDIELVEKLKEVREESFNLRLRHATGELEDTAALGRAKKDLARLLTIAHQRNIDLERESKHK
ncbi:MAG TPA: 50S ribosomal protein L29 [Solirubrobacterales bacterium]|nr:50S ribosomal protein L29 [Solirubrobacterales bacterium]HMU26731.1 50S ribosomal protein L29 [Solirubrobacterales bacterium]HMW44268.1 50S ribosomal protein L29 [Solirubrobacterales bacterium]HMX70950.1 50S ribosomal protein L29 [Solirubrobacterales bacterium]HMY26110.1 50S ribosomal protein L29 [Solirubrobacterales bacterium]